MYTVSFGGQTLKNSAETTENIDIGDKKEAVDKKEGQLVKVDKQLGSLRSWNFDDKKKAFKAQAKTIAQL